MITFGVTLNDFCVFVDRNLGVLMMIMMMTSLVTMMLRHLMRKKKMMGIREVVGDITTTGDTILTIQNNSCSKMTKLAEIMSIK